MTGPTAVLWALPERGWGVIRWQSGPSDVLMTAMVAAGLIHAQRTPTAWQARLTGEGRRLRRMSALGGEPGWCSRRMEPCRPECPPCALNAALGGARDKWAEALAEAERLSEENDQLRRIAARAHHDGLLEGQGY